ncbi:sarcosine oxidase subunit gamma family protein [Amphritea sp. 1_MG-2023]|uniref:sarcosine oxidase subunit gamma n=1 Tax=Amphritea sp. 1_MG-2023 TaxID=3062670 RepID=UPI0026E21BAB|nr:sarcosine oxidase subunit gamma family protein [Amphritea sp. 1_MG-2023]MDO6564998.1 sarcosine oxidase subunit gamma family protein [Amphritea sp. 1_MG-2023]
MSVITPEAFDSRSFIYRQHQQAEFTEVAGAAQVSSYKGQSHSAMGLTDLSVLPRFGLRGPAAGEALIAAGLLHPEQPNSLTVADDGVMVLRLGYNEYWLLALPGAEVDLTALEQQLIGPGIYPVYCHDSFAWMVMSGDHLADVLAKVCAVDLSEACFKSGDLVMTSLARVSGVICHHQMADKHVFSIFSDSASASYLWDALLDAMGEFDGAPAGQNILIK